MPLTGLPHRVLHRIAADPFRALLVGGLAVPAVMFAGGAYLDRSREYADARFSIQSAAGLAQLHAQNAISARYRVLNQAQSLLSHYGSDEDIRKHAEDIQPAMQELLGAGLGKNDTQVQDVYAIGVDGFPMVDARHSSYPIPQSLGDRDYFQAARDRPDEIFSSKAQTGLINKTTFFSLSQAIVRDGQFVGVIAVSSRPSYYLDFWNRMETVQTGGIVTLMQDDGRALASTSDKLETMPPEAPHFQDALRLLRAQIARSPEEGVYSAPSAVDGGTLMIAYRHLADGSGYVLVSYLASLIDQAWGKTMLYHLYFGVPATCAMILFALLARSYAGKLRRLTETEYQTRKVLGVVVGLTDYTICRLDPAGLIMSWDQAAEKNTGYSPHEAVGMDFRKLFAPEDLEAGIPDLALSLAADGGYAAECWRLRKDGTRFWVSVVISPICSDAGKLIGFTKVARDMTEKQETGKRLAQAQKMEALGQLTGGVAHDFNNLLTVILGSVELAESAVQGVGDVSTQRKMLRYLGAMRNACLRGASLTQHLLAFSRRQPLQPVVVNPSAILSEAAAMLTKTIRANIRLEVKVPDVLPPIKIDPSQLAMALLNVVLNARDAMPDGGVLEVGAHDALLQGQNGLTGQFVAIHVVDTGSGIPEENLQKVLEPFFTTKVIGKGSGLGLSQAYGFCRQSGGTLVLQSKVGRGTRVSFYLPVTEEAVAEQTDTAAVLHPFNAIARGRVLVVEDDLAVAEVVLAMLEQGGYHVTHASAAKEALALLGCGESFDLLFSDIMMPGGLLGVDLADCVARDFPGIPILLTTGYSDEHSGQPISYPLITKPYRAQELLDRVSALVDAGRTNNAIKKTVVFI